MSSRLFVLAGEPSGDTRAAGMCRSILALAPDVELRGVGGAKMKSAGVDLVMNLTGEGVVGLWEVIGKLHFFSRVYRQVISEIRQFDPDAVVLVDFPGFNLKLAEQLYRERIPVIYYISPQVWAWRKYRIGNIRRYVDLMIVLFQFEAEMYREHGVNVEWVGHPLVDEINNDDLDRAGDKFDRGSPLMQRPEIGLLPGSRVSEFTRLYPHMIEAVRMLREQMEIGRVRVPIAPELPTKDLYRYRADDMNGEEWLEGKAREVIRGADIILTASGTTTLEAAILETPMVVCYRVNPITWAIGLMLIQTEHISLVNLVAGEKIVPECIQWQATASRMSDEMRNLLQRENYEECRKNLSTVREKLGKPGASKRAAEAVLNYLSQT